MSTELIQMTAESGVEISVSRQEAYYDRGGRNIQITVACDKVDETYFCLNFNQWRILRDTIDRSYGIEYPDPDEEFEKGRESVKKQLREFKELFKELFND